MPIVSEDYEDIFQSPAHYIVIPVNTYGVAGAGLALKMKEQSPCWFYYYKRGCRKKEFHIDALSITRVPDWHQGIISVATKGHWKERSSPERIERIFSELVKLSESTPLSSVAIPPIGCGRGELDYKQHFAPAAHRQLQSARFDARICMSSMGY